MRQIFNIALNDLRIALRGRGTQVTLFIVPVIMTVLIGSATAGGSFTAVIDVIRSDPGDKLASDFVTQLRAEGGSQLLVCDLAAIDEQNSQCKLSSATDKAIPADQVTLARQRIERGDTLAAVTIPTGFSNDLMQGKNVQIEFISQGGLNAPQVAREKVDAVLTRMSGTILAARVATEKANPATDQRQSFYDKVYTAAQALWAKDPIVIDDQTSTVTGTGVGGMGQSAPGMGAMFVMTNVLAAAAVFIQERKMGTLPRLVVLPLTRAQILAGKLLGRYLLGLLTFAIMIVVGTLLNVRWGDLLGAVVVVLAYTLAVTAMALALSTVVRSQAQASGIALLVTMTLAPLGGAWWPLSIVPQWMQTIGYISPIAWSQSAFTRMIFYGAHLIDVLPAVGVLLLFAAVFFAFGLTRFRYE